MAPSASMSSFAGRPLHVRVGLGLAALGRPGYINLNHDAHLGADKSVDALEAHSHSVLDAAYARGIRHFDAARSYGSSEAFLSSWLSKRNIKPKEDVLVTSKWGYSYTAGFRVDTGGEPHEVKEHSAANLAKQVLETAELLGEYVDVYQIHSATIDSGFLNDDVLEALAKVKEERGWRLGLTLSGTGQADTLRTALERAPSDLFSCVQATWNVYEQSVGDALLEASQKGLDVIIKEAMANGRVLRSPAVTQMADELGVTPDALALACALALPCNPVVLSGAATGEHVSSNVDAVSALDVLMSHPGAREKLLEQCRMDPKSYWDERSQLAWN